MPSTDTIANEAKEEFQNQLVVCGFTKTDCTKIFKGLSIIPITALVFGLTLVPSYYLAKLLIEEDPISFHDIIKFYKFQVIATWLSVTILTVVTTVCSYFIIRSMIECFEIRKQIRENAEREITRQQQNEVIIGIHRNVTTITETPRPLVLTPSRGQRQPA